MAEWSLNKTSNMTMLYLAKFSEHNIKENDKINGLLFKLRESCADTTTLSALEEQLQEREKFQNQWIKNFQKLSRAVELKEKQVKGVNVSDFQSVASSHFNS